MSDPEVYANLDDLRARLTGEEVSRLDAFGNDKVEELLKDVSALIRARCSVGEDTDRQILKMVTCRVALRALRKPSVPQGVSSMDFTAGPFRQNFSLDTSAGEVFLTRQDRADINGGSSSAHEVDLLRETWNRDYS